MALNNTDSTAIVQVFRVAVPDNVPGCFLTKLDLFFFKKSRTFGVEIFLMEVVNGEPDPETVIANSVVVKEADDIIVSNDGTAATTFVFPEPIYVESNRRYAFAVRPVNNNPDYQLWVGSNGRVDVATGRVAAANPLSESAYFAKQATTEMAEMMDEDVKYRLYRARFNTNSVGSVTLHKTNEEMFAVTDLALAPGIETLSTGDVVYMVDPASNRAVLTAKATISRFDVRSGIMHLKLSTGQFVSGRSLMFIREAVEGDPYSPGSSWLGTGFLASIMDFTYHHAIPKVGTLVPPMTRTSWALRGVNRASGATLMLDGSPTTVENGVETELTDMARHALSFSNERTVIPAANTSSVAIQGSFVSDSNFLSPVIDLDHCSFVAAVNDINNSFVGETTNYGQAACRYISRVVTLADGMEAEDLKVFVSAFRPPTSGIKVYAKVWNAADDDTFDEKLWTEMTPGGPNVPSDPQNRNDFREHSYDMPSRAVTPNLQQAAVETTGVVGYSGTSGATYSGFKKYSIKVVLAVSSAETAVNPPILTDVRAIALQI